MLAKPSNYDTACPASRRIVDLLAQHLLQLAPELIRNDVSSMTTFGAPGHSKFVFAYLKKKKEDGTVYFIGNLEVPYSVVPGMPPLRKRPKYANSRTKLTPYFTVIDTVEQVEPFARFLGEYSMPLAASGRARKSGPEVEFRSPDEVPDDERWEGHAARVLVNRYERDRKARESCLISHGASCSACGLSFAQMYGDEYANCVQVHHLTPISKMAGRYKVNPKRDLVPLCPNWHM